MTVEDLEAERNEIELAIAQIRTQIEYASTKAHETGEYAPADWYVRAKAALRFKGRRHQELLREIARLRREDRAKRNGGLAFEHAFIDAARRRLAPETFTDLMREAHEATEGTNARAETRAQEEHDVEGQSRTD